jgi:RHS repeat-associated protein
VLPISGSSVTVGDTNSRLAPWLLVAVEIIPASSGTVAETYSYDLLGNRVAATPAGGATTALKYDQANRLVAFGNGATYAYDGGGLRTKKSVSGATTSFTWNQMSADPLMLQAAGTSYVYGPGSEPIEQVSGTTVTYLHQDQQGSTRLLTDGSGSVVGTYSYGPYGNVLAHSGTASTDLGYDGQYADSESGLYYLRARYYDPTTAQFLTVDPMVAKTMSPYGYTAGNPLNSSDPSGMDNDYYYSWDMGPARSGGPQATLWWLTHRADYEFPFTIHDLASSYTVHSFGAISDVGGTTSTLCAGNNYAISAGGGSQPIHVDYAGMQGNVAVLEFTALPGHVEGTGSTIRFSSWISADGHQHFDVTGHDTYNYDGVPASWPLGFFAGSVTHIADAFAVQSMWNQLATQVNGGSYPNG